MRGDADFHAGNSPDHVQPRRITSTDRGQSANRAIWEALWETPRDFLIAGERRPRHACPSSKMNPDKLFDYLEGKVSPHERAELEERLIADPQLRRELTVARQIHADGRDSREVPGFAEPMLEERGAVLGRRFATAFAVLVFANVVFGIYAIAFMKTKER